jgi:hypothetical protein
VREIRKKFDERIQQEIAKVTSDDIVEALAKRVLTHLQHLVTKDLGIRHGPWSVVARLK